MQRRFSWRRLAVMSVLLVLGTSGGAQGMSVAEGKAAYEAGDFSKAVEILKAATAKDPKDGEAELLLVKCYLELNKIDAAISSGEKAVAIDPKNSEFHHWLGQAFSVKAEHASMFNGMGLAKKTQKEFQTATELDGKNISAMQDLVEYDCTAPGIVGGGEDKAQPIIQKLMVLDPAEGHYAKGNCKAAKKELPVADEEFIKALENRLKSVERIYEIANYFSQRGQGDNVLAAADAGVALAPADARGTFYRAVGLVVKKEKLADAKSALKQYLQDTPKHPGDPKPFRAHYWLGRAYEAEKNADAAREEYHAALGLNEKYKPAQEGLKRLGNS